MKYEPRVGDVVVVNWSDGDGDRVYFSAGLKARLTRFDGFDWWADFSGLGNDPRLYTASITNGIWCIGVAGTDFELVDAATTPTLEQLVTLLLEVVHANHTWHMANDDHGGYPGSELHDANLKAIEAAAQVRR